MVRYALLKLTRSLLLASIAVGVANGAASQVRAASTAQPAARAVSRAVGVASDAPAPAIGQAHYAAPLLSTPPVLAPCTYAARLVTDTSYANWAGVLLDTTYMLPASYAPPDLHSTGLRGGGSVRGFVLGDLHQMAAAAAAAGAPLQVVSAYRSYDNQAGTFNHWVGVDGYLRALLSSARAGHSEHQLGTAIDFMSIGDAAPWTYRDWATTRAGAWLRDNAWKYGFISSYPEGKTSVTCYAYEPWHYRYFGRSVAASIHASGLTTRAWLPANG